MQLHHERCEALRRLGERVEDGHELHRRADALARYAHARRAAGQVVWLQLHLAVLAGIARECALGDARQLYDCMHEYVRAPARGAALDARILVMADCQLADQVRGALGALTKLVLLEQRHVDCIERRATREQDEATIGDQRARARA